MVKNICDSIFFWLNGVDGNNINSLSYYRAIKESLKIQNLIKSFELTIFKIVNSINWFIVILLMACETGPIKLQFLLVSGMVCISIISLMAKNIAKREKNEIERKLEMVDDYIIFHIE